MANQVELSEKQKKVLGFGCLGVIVLVVIVVIVVMVGGGGGNVVEDLEGTGSRDIAVAVPATNGFVDFTVKHEADAGFESWGLYYNGALIDANNGDSGSETVVYQHEYGQNRIVYTLEVDAATDCHWAIEIVD